MIVKVIEGRTAPARDQAHLNKRSFDQALDTWDAGSDDAVNDLVSFLFEMGDSGNGNAYPNWISSIPQNVTSIPSRSGSPVSLFDDTDTILQILAALATRPRPMMVMRITLSRTDLLIRRMNVMGRRLRTKSVATVKAATPRIPLLISGRGRHTAFGVFVFHTADSGLQEAKRKPLVVMAIATGRTIIAKMKTHHGVLSRRSRKSE
jgi:hypothetical protein